MPELHGCIRASDLTRMANTCESPVEPSSVSVGLRQLSASAKMACNQSSQFGYAARYYKVAGGKAKPKRGIDAFRGTWQSRPLANGQQYRHGQANREVSRWVWGKGRCKKRMAACNGWHID